MASGYDIVTVGGGLAGATLAGSMAERGYRVLVLERERQFRDRVRGEQMHPWGVTEARALGVYAGLSGAGGLQTRWWTTYVGAVPVRRRDLERTPHGVGSFNCYHPAMQEHLLASAAARGAEVRRGVTVERVVPGTPALVSYHENGIAIETRSRLVVGADGRASQVRAWAGANVRRDPDFLSIAGALVEGAHLPPDDGVHVAGGAEGRVLIAPQRGGRARVYFMCRSSASTPPLSGKRGEAAFLSRCQAAVAPADWFESASIVGPVAQFSAADQWVEQPVSEGVALLGDAAATSNPCFGTGLSLALVGVRALRDRLLGSDDWPAALAAYADDHARAYGTIHRLTTWFAELLYAPGPSADERRAKVLPRLATAARAPDITGLGPASPSDDAAHRLLTGEDD